MAKKNRPSYQKREREQKKRQRKLEKAQKTADKRDQKLRGDEPETDESGVNENANPVGDEETPTESEAV